MAGEVREKLAVAEGVIRLPLLPAGCYRVTCAGAGGGTTPMVKLQTAKGVRALCWCVMCN